MIKMDDDIVLQANVAQNDEHEGDYDWKIAMKGMICVRELVLPTYRSMTYSTNKLKILKFGVRDMLKLKKVVTANVLYPHLT